MKYESVNSLSKSSYLIVKRFMDISFCLIASIFIIPIIIVLCLLVVLESSGNPIFIQQRVGKNGKLFNIYKIRSMHYDAEALTGPKWADKDDTRVTKIGKFIRRTRIDELPQIFNIMKGDMSIVGPRPERPIFVAVYEKETPEFAQRLLVKPGLTGLAQVIGGYEISYKKKLKYDLEYIQKQSIWLDTKIIIQTIWIVFSGKGAR